MQVGQQHNGRYLPGCGRRMAGSPLQAGEQLIRWERTADGECPGQNARDLAGIRHPPAPAPMHHHAVDANHCHLQGVRRQAAGDLGDSDNATLPGGRAQQARQFVKAAHMPVGDHKRASPRPAQGEAWG